MGRVEDVGCPILVSAAFCGDRGGDFDFASKMPKCRRQLKMRAKVFVYEELAD
jgi:hypothetical protein